MKQRTPLNRSRLAPWLFTAFTVGIVVLVLALRDRGAGSQNGPGPGSGTQNPRHAAYRRAVENSRPYFESVRNPAMEMDVWLALHVIEREMKGLIPSRLLDREYPNDPRLRVLRKSLGKVPPGLKSRTDPTAYFEKAIYCDKIDYDQEDLRDLMSRKKGDGGYADTHVLLSLLMLRENNCYSRRIVERHINEMVDVIYRAQQRGDQFYDRFVERVAFLYFAGRGDLVEEAWIRRIVADQKDDGGWGVFEALLFSVEHPTVLSVMCLLFWMEGSPSQRFYPVYDN